MDVSELNRMIKSRQALLDRIGDVSSGSDSRQDDNSYAAYTSNSDVTSSTSLHDIEVELENLGLSGDSRAMIEQDDSEIQRILDQDRARYMPTSAADLDSAKLTPDGAVASLLGDIGDAVRYIVANTEPLVSELARRHTSPGLTLPVQYHRPLFQLLSHAANTRCAAPDGHQGGVGAGTPHTQWANVVKQLHNVDLSRLAHKMEASVSEQSTQVRRLESMCQDTCDVRRMVCSLSENS